MAIEDFYDQAALIQRPNRSSTPMGGNRTNWTTRIASVACRVSYTKVRGATSSTESNEFGKVTVRNLVVMYCEASGANLAISEKDRAIINSKTYEITGIANPGMQNHHLEIMLEEII